jgi:hypothetical protein
LTVDHPLDLEQCIDPVDRFQRQRRYQCRAGFLLILTSPRELLRRRRILR